MAFMNKDGLLISYDYSELLQDIKHDLFTSDLDMEDQIVVERDAKGLSNTVYHQILDYYDSMSMAKFAIGEGHANKDNKFEYIQVETMIREMREISKTI